MSSDGGVMNPVVHLEMNLEQIEKGGQIIPKLNLGEMIPK
jgi:hypothetical protein